MNQEVKVRAVGRWCQADVQLNRVLVGLCNKAMLFELVWVGVWKWVVWSWCKEEPFNRGRGPSRMDDGAWSGSRSDMQVYENG